MLYEDRRSYGTNLSQYTLCSTWVHRVLTIYCCVDDESVCTAQSCSNGGECIQEWNTFSCNCDLTSFTGPTCDNGSPMYLLNIVLICQVL